MTATYNVGSLAGTGWHNVSQAAFASSLVPGFLADNPAASAIWVKANSSSLQFRLRWAGAACARSQRLCCMLPAACVHACVSASERAPRLLLPVHHACRMALDAAAPRTVRVDTLSWQLPRPLGLLFPGAAADVRDWRATRHTCCMLLTLAAAALASLHKRQPNLLLLCLIMHACCTQVTASVVNATLSNTTQAIALAISLTFRELPPPGAATNVTAGNVMDLLKVCADAARLQLRCCCCHEVSLET